MAKTAPVIDDDPFAHIGADVEASATDGDDPFAHIVEPEGKPWYAPFRDTTPSSTKPYSERAAERVATEKTDAATAQHQLQDKYGTAYDPSTKFEYSATPSVGVNAGKPAGLGIGDVIRGADIGRSEDIADKQAKFQERYPHGTLQMVDTKAGKKLVGRRTPDEQFRELAKFPEFLGAALSEPTILGTAGSYAAPFIGTAVGTAGGEMAKQKIEQMRGYGYGIDPYAAARSGVAAGGVDLLTRGLLHGAGVAPAGPMNATMDNAVQSAIDEGLKPLTVGQTSRWPLVRKMWGQVAQTSARPAAIAEEQQKTLLDAVNKQIDDGVGLGGMTEPALANVVAAQRNELANIISPQNLSRQGAGESLQKGLKVYQEASGRLADRLYQKAADNADGITFNIGGAKQVARDVQAGVEGLGEAGQGVRASPRPKGELREALNDLNNLKSDVIDYKDNSAYDILKNLRTRFFYLKQSPDPFVSGTAKRVYGELTGAMDNPVGYPGFEPSLGAEAGSPTLTAAQQAKNDAFVAAHQKARDFWRTREDALEKTFVAKSLATDTPEKIAATYFRPGNTTALQTIQELVPRSQWQNFRQSFTADVMGSKSAQEGLTKLDNFSSQDPDGLKLLLNPNEEKMLRGYLTKRAQFDNSPVNAALTKNMTDIERSIALVRNGSAQDMADLVRLSGGNRSVGAQGLKAGIYKDILDNSTFVSEGGKTALDGGRLAENIKGWQQSGKLDNLFTKRDWDRINNYQKYASTIGDAGNDAGSSIQAGALRAGLIQAPAKIIVEGAGMNVLKRTLIPIWNNRTAAWVLSRPRMSAAARLPNSIYNQLVAGNVGLSTIERDMGAYSEKRPQP